MSDGTESTPKPPDTYTERPVIVEMIEIAGISFPCLVMPAKADEEAERWVFLPKVKIVDKVSK